MKKIFLLFAVLGVSLASAQTVYKCFQSDDNPKLALMAKSVNGTIVSVKYKGQKQAIPLTNGHQKAADIDLNELYLEKYNGKITGRYTFTNTPNDETLQYERMKDGKFYYFTLSPSSYVNNAFRRTPCW